MRLVLLGPPGAGKGTQATRLASRYGLTHVSTGDIFRTNVAQGTELGREAERYMDAGELVPDEVVVRMVRETLEGIDGGFLLDGFPRTVGQAEALEAALSEAGRPLTAVLAFDLDDEVALRRLAGRRTCERCGAVFHVEFDPPEGEGVCDVCGGPLAQRSDDAEETVRRRIAVFHETGDPLRGWYEERGLVHAIDADATPDEVFARAEDVLDAPAKAAR